jgi:hypothetical protein
MPSEITAIADIRSVLTNLLSSELGIFTNGKPAIWVEPPQTPFGSVTGLQCVIQRYQNLNTTKVLHNSQTAENFDWIIVLTQFDPTDNGMQKLDSAVTKIRLRFPRRRERIMPFRENAYPQVSYLLNFSQVVNNYPQEIS